MKLSEYIKHLIKIENLFGGDLKVIYSADEEGNDYAPVLHHPTPGKWDPKAFADLAFETVGSTECLLDLKRNDKGQVNAVCIT